MSDWAKGSALESDTNPKHKAKPRFGLNETSLERPENWLPKVLQLIQFISNIQLFLF